MKLQCFLNFHSIESDSHLRELLEHREHGYGAFWYIDEDSSPLLGLFISGDLACLHHDESGQWSFNPKFKGSPEETFEFAL